MNDPLEAMIAQIPDDLRDAFLERLEAAWGGIWLQVEGVERPGCRVMTAAWDWAMASDPSGVDVWLTRL